ILKRHGDGTRTLETIQRTGIDLPETVITLDTDTGRVALAGSLEERRLMQAVAQVIDVVGPQVRTEEDIQAALAGDRRMIAKAIRAAFKAGKLPREGSGKRGDAYRYFRPDEDRAVEERRSSEGGKGVKGPREKPVEEPPGADSPFP